MKKSFWLITASAICSVVNIFSDTTDVEMLIPVIMICAGFIVWAIEDSGR